ncbi:hypothetical protein ACH4E8_29335 [Streptomyces sp. NPDC017979]|uniref:hypothetical protein n=1 Tax=Streptomyces sp. NPDC017979 TaxID=3365024 RepID=UPI00379D2130
MTGPLVISASDADLHRDVRLAWTLAQAAPMRQQALRDRLRQHIGALTGPAEAYADTITDEGHRSIVIAGIASARAAAVGVDPAVLPGEELMVLAEYIKTLLLYGRQATAAAP